VEFVRSVGIMSQTASTTTTTAGTAETTTTMGTPSSLGVSTPSTTSYRSLIVIQPAFP